MAKNRTHTAATRAMRVKKACESGLSRERDKGQADHNKVLKKKSNKTAPPTFSLPIRVKITTPEDNVPVSPTPAVVVESSTIQYDAAQDTAKEVKNLVRKIVAAEAYCCDNYYCVFTFGPITRYIDGQAEWAELMGRFEKLTGKAYPMYYMLMKKEPDTYNRFGDWAQVYKVMVADEDFTLRKARAA